MIPEVAMAKLLDDEVDLPVRERVRCASVLYDQIEELKVRVAELEDTLARERAAVAETVRAGLGRDAGGDAQ